jgi:cell division septation protein DedD
MTIMQKVIGPDGKETTKAVVLPVIQAVVQAVRTDGDANIMAAPQILTADNAEAQIIVGENRPFPTQQLQAATTTGTATSPFQTSTTIERKDVGVTLRVTPQITEGDSVRMKIFTQISDVTDAGGALGPITSNRQIENTVHVSDGESVMIGGIIKDKLTSDRTRVPWLGDIPLLGQLFSYRSNTVTKTNMMLLLTPHIVRAPGDLEQLTLEQREKFRSASEAGAADPDVQERRRKAKAAGLDLPEDPNPVRRELGGLEQRYPTEKLPDLREQREQREEERRQRLEQEEEAPAPQGAAAPPAPAAPGPGSIQTREPQQGPGRPAPEAQQRTAAGSYLVQIEPLEDSKRALDLLGQLNALGHEGSVVLQQEQGRSLYFIRLGPYPTEADAKRAGQAVEKATGLDAFVMLGQ